MQTSLSVIKHIIKTGAAVDWTTADDVRRPYSSTTIFYSIGASGLNGIVIRDDVTGTLYAVAGRTTNLFILAR